MTDNVMLVRPCNCSCLGRHILECMCMPFLVTRPARMYDVVSVISKVISYDNFKLFDLDSRIIIYNVCLLVSTYGFR